LITRARLSERWWRRLLPDVHIRADVLLDHNTWCRAALLIAPVGAVLGFRSALGMYCPTLMPSAGAAVELIVPRDKTLRRHPGLRVHRMAVCEQDITWWRGFPITTPARTGFDLARGPNLIEAVIGLDALLGQGLTTLDEMAVYAKRPLPGRARARRAMALAATGAESPMETRTRLVLVLAGLPPPERQHEVRDGSFVARFDLAYPEYRLGIEYDGAHHRDLEVFQRDAVRANRLRLRGWLILRFTANDVLRHPDRVARQVHAGLVSQGWCPVNQPDRQSR
jgi:very-short-patch-repair endonuclease